MKLLLDPSDFASCPEYNDWIDTRHAEENGAKTILGYNFRPSYALFLMSPDTYQAAFDDFQREREDNLQEAIFGAFPSSVAYYFYRFENGYENQIQRLLFLRDTWEATIDFLHALVIGEIKFRNVALSAPIQFRDILSDRIAQRLLTIERMIDRAQAAGVELVTSAIVSPKTLEVMRELNRSRNGFSHSAAQSEQQAQAWISECYTDVLDLLDDLRELANVEVFRYLGQQSATVLRGEIFKGHSLTRTIRNLPFEADQIQICQKFLQQGQILACYEGAIFGLRPLVHYREDASGHLTKLCSFRRSFGEPPHRRFEFEVTGEASRWEVMRTEFKPELDELRALFGLGPD